MRWARRQIIDEDIDVAGFMWDFHRTLNTEEFPDGETVIYVKFSELDEFGKWWLIVKDNIVDLCAGDPGRDVDLYVVGSLPALIEVWMGDVDVRSAIENENIMLTGASYLTRTTAQWFPKSSYADVRPKRVLS